MGVGAATARKFASLGANLVLASRGKKALEEIAAELKPLTKVVIYPMDVADPSACAGLLKKALYEFGAIPERELEELKAEAERRSEPSRTFAFHMDRLKEE